MTLVAGAFAAFVQDDLRHAVGYLVIADAGIVLLGFAALDPAAWGPTRVWLVAMAASKTAVAAWAAVMEDRFSTRSVPDLRGWLRHSPILAAALVIAALATYGLPGWVAFEARGDLARLASPDFAWLIVLAGVATLPTYVRLIAVGTGPATSRVRGAPPERWAKRRRQETLPVTVEGAPSTGAAGGRWDRGGRQGRHAGAAPRRTAARDGRFGREDRRARVASALRRDRTELLAAAVLALAILAGLTSWGALDLGGAASEAAPTVSGPAAD